MVNTISKKQIKKKKKSTPDNIDLLNTLYCHSRDDHKNGVISSETYQYIKSLLNKNFTI